MTTMLQNAPAVKTSPVTSADLTRARYFGLTIPAPAPAPTVAVEAALVVEPTANPRDSWPEWTDEDCWTTEAPFVAEPLPAESNPVEFQADDESANGLIMERVAITPRVSVQVNTSPTPIYYPRPIEAKGPKPTHNFGFIPTHAEQVEATELLRDDRPGHFTMLSRRPAPIARKARPVGSGVINDMSAYGIDPWGQLSDHELMECRGHRQVTGYDV
jgi:hypothetical protein